MEKLEQFRTEHPLRFMAVAGALVFFTGLGVGTFLPLFGDDKAVIVREVTPQVCRQALWMDDEIFVTVGEHIGQFDFAGASEYVEGVTERRLALYDECMEK